MKCCCCLSERPASSWEERKPKALTSTVTLGEVVVPLQNADSIHFSWLSWKPKTAALSVQPADWTSAPWPPSNWTELVYHHMSQGYSVLYCNLSLCQSESAHWRSARQNVIIVRKWPSFHWLEASRQPAGQQRRSRINPGNETTATAQWL